MLRLLKIGTDRKRSSERMRGPIGVTTLHCLDPKFPWSSEL